MQSVNFFTLKFYYHLNSFFFQSIPAILKANHQMKTPRGKNIISRLPMLFVEGVDF